MTTVNTINTTINRTEREKLGDDKPHHKYPINSDNNVTSCINNNLASNRNDDLRSPFMIYHQNIRGVKGKIDEFLIHLLRETLDIICPTEHHLMDYEIDVTHTPTYKLGAKFCRKNLKIGSACIFIQEDLKFTTINVQKHCKEQDLEIAAIQIRRGTT
jgi:hypothetical protein